MHKTLSRWIAQTSSYETSIEFKIPNEYISSYDFLPRQEDLYISLIGEAFSLLNADDYSDSEYVNEDLRSLATGFQYYRLIVNSKNLSTEERNSTLLICGNFFYLSGYPATAQMIVSSLNPEHLTLAIEKFTYAFLSHKIDADLEECRQLQLHLNGDSNALKRLVKELKRKADLGLNSDAHEYIFSKLMYQSLKRFSSTNVWQLKPLLNSDESDIFIRSLVERKDPVWEFFPSQWKAISSGLLANKATTTLQMPTSAGKTAITELVIFEFLQRNPEKTVLLLAPFRALASELKNGFCKRLSKIGVSSKVIYGGGTSTNSENSSLAKAQLIVSTPEKFMAVDSVDPDLRSNIGLLICDEGHLIDAGHRGLTYELLLSSFRKDDDQEQIKIVFISAIVPNAREIHEWLNGTDENLIESKYRPSSLDFSVISKDQHKNLHLTVNPADDFPKKFFLKNFIRPEEFRYIRESTGRQNTYPITSDFLNISMGAALKSCEIGPVALFTTQKTSVYSLAEKFLSIVNAMPSFSQRKNCNRVPGAVFREFLNFHLGEESTLHRIAEHGFTYHHGDLTQELREKCEWAIREKAVQAIICTNTLAEGVNLPVRTLVIHTIRRMDMETQRWRYISKRDIKNIVGRAGRAGKAIKGLVILSNESEQHVFKEVINEIGIEEVNGGLFAAVTDLASVISAESEITNELLEALEGKHSESLDKIDSALISLFNPDSEEVELLAGKTFAFTKLPKKDQHLLENLFKLRWSELSPLTETGEINILKESFLPPRKYKFIKELVSEMTLDLPLEETAPDSKEVVTFYLDLLLQIKDFEDLLARFNSIHKTRLNKNILTKIGIMWLKGNVYKDIAQEINQPVELIITIISNIFGHQTQSLIRAINATIESQFTLNDSLPFCMENFGECLSNGINNEDQLKLMEIGIGDRIVVRHIADLIKDDPFTYLASRRSLRMNLPTIRNYLNDKVPRISILDLNEALS